MACKVSTSEPSTAEFRTVRSPMIGQSVMMNWDRSGVSRHLHGGTEETCVEGQGSRCAGTDGELVTHGIAVLQYRLRRSVRYLKNIKGN
jgi:hypothetical protein